MTYLDAALPGVEIVYLTINRAPQKQVAWNVVDEANKMVFDFVQKKDSWHYVDVNCEMEDSSGKIKRNIFDGDGLHLTDNCYTNIFKPAVTKVLKPIWERIMC